MTTTPNTCFHCGRAYKIQGSICASCRRDRAVRAPFALKNQAPDRRRPTLSDFVFYVDVGNRWYGRFLEDEGR